MNIHIATDHAGFDLKEKLKNYLNELGHEVTDHGAFELNEKDDYPDFISLAAYAVVEDPNARGIILGGSGQGEAMCANRFKGIRAAVFYGGSLEIVKRSREHNDANMLSLGARFVTEDEAKNAVKLFLETEFSNEERHMRRLSKF
jgi:ribose 5-phosphate isomerase B